jgi:hypothetical protein
MIKFLVANPASSTASVIAHVKVVSLSSISDYNNPVADKIIASVNHRKDETFR